jgi:hypothetical protein
MKPSPLNGIEHIRAGKFVSTIIAHAFETIAAREGFVQTIIWVEPNPAFEPSYGILEITSLQLGITPFIGLEGSYSPIPHFSRIIPQSINCSSLNWWR